MWRRVAREGLEVLTGRGAGRQGQNWEWRLSCAKATGERGPCGSEGVSASPTAPPHNLSVVPAPTEILKDGNGLGPK